MKNLGIQTGTSNAGLTHRIQEIKDRNENFKHKVEKLDILVKENTKSKTVLAQNIQEIYIIKLKNNKNKFKNNKKKGRRRSIFNIVIEKNFPNLNKMSAKVQEEYKHKAEWTRKKLPSAQNKPNNKHT